MIRIASGADDILPIAAASGIPGLNAPRAREIVEAAVANAECLVHEDLDLVVNGFVITYRRAFFGRDFVKLLAVSHDARRHGIGERLLHSALESALTDTVFITTNQSNGAMRALLRRDHWIFSGRLSGIDENDLELVFRKRRDVLAHRQ